MSSDPVATHGVRDRVEEILSRLEEPGSEERRSFRQLYSAEARAAAGAADARDRRGLSLGPLDGRIVSIKDLFDVAGSVTAAGARIRESRSPAVGDAEAVRRLKAAGAIPIGHTVMSEYAFSGVGLNPHHGCPGNPVDRLRIPGGSSSGAAVSVADGIADIGLGSDTGGSLRIPAALCGLVGFKPGRQRVPTDGAFPLSPTLDVVGPIGRTVADCADAFAVLSETRLEPFGGLADGVLPLRLGVITSQRLMDSVDAVVGGAFEDALRRLGTAGATIVEFDLEAVLDGIASMQELGSFPAVELAAALADLPQTEMTGIDPRIRARIETGWTVSAVDYLWMQRMRVELREHFAGSWGTHDALLLPTVPIVAPLAQDLSDDDAFRAVNLLLLRNTSVFNILDVPSVSIPMITSGLPAGLSIIGRPGQDERLLEVAWRIEQHLLTDLPR